MLVVTLAAAAPAHVVYGWGPGPWFLIFPLFWLLAIAAILITVSRRRRAWHGAGPWGGPSQGHGGPWAGSSRSARAVLAERFARGEIDEAEYRARLEVLIAAEPPRQP
ncbi:SHOCT domain-containing protein [Pengzhenrongella sp.]|jgi:putative membrane protein|uniref:SHOCT domain-containing protein n=1 Tax=Pengzhenrongella sp. TaxID=2888820 RepID=UPI002F92D328